MSGQAENPIFRERDRIVWSMARSCGPKPKRGKAFLMRTHAPVRRFSKPAEVAAGSYWRPFDRNEVSRFMLAAERYERVRRAKGHRCGPLGPVGLEVMRELLRLVDFRTGRLEPAILTLCKRLKRSKDAIVRALANLKAAGFLDWIRRWIADEEGKVRQTTNAYRFVMPPAAIALLGHLMGAPASEDFDQAREDKAARLESMLNELEPDEQMKMRFGDRPLAGPMAALMKGIKKNEA